MKRIQNPTEIGVESMTQEAFDVIYEAVRKQVPSLTREEFLSTAFEMTRWCEGWDGTLEDFAKNFGCVDAPSLADYYNQFGWVFEVMDSKEAVLAKYRAGQVMLDWADEDPNDGFQMASGRVLLQFIDEATQKCFIEGEI